MIRFLRLFTAYRLLEQRVSSLEVDVMEADSRARYLQDKAVLAETRLHEAQAENSTTLKRLANYQAIQAGCVVVPFPDVHIEMRKPPEDDLSKGAVFPQGFGPRLARDVQRDRVAASRAEAAAKLAAYSAGLREKVDHLGLDSL